MKKIVCLLLCVMMLVPNAVFANASTLESLTLSVKERIEIPSELTKFTSNIRTLTDSGTSYVLSWTNEDYDKQIEVTVNEHGDITRYYTYDYNDERIDSGMAKFEKTYFIKTAKLFVEKVNPSWVSELDFDVDVDLSNLYSETVSVDLYRNVNGLPFCNNYVGISINKYTGEIERFYSNWTYAENISDVNEVLPEADLKKVFEEKSGVVLKYMTKADSDNAILVYVPKDSSIIINAITGEVEEPEELYFGDMKESVGSNSAMRDETGSGGLTKEELAEISRMDNLISQDKAEKIANSLENTYIANLKLTNIEYIKRNEGEDFKYIVGMSFEGEDSYANVTLDAENGELISMYAYGNTTKSGGKISADKLRQNADKFISKYASDVASKTNVFDETSPRFKYSQSVDGIEYASNNISVTVDEYTGKITRFSKNWDDKVTFESTDGILTNEDALSVLYEKIGFKTYYFNTKDGAKIGYSLNENIPYYIDAKSGEILSYNLEEYVPDDKILGTASDLEGHYAKEYIDALMENGIIKYEETFRPDDTVTVKEALEFLVCLERGYVPYDRENYMYVNLAKEIFDGEEYDENAIITREETAKYIIKASTDYEEIAKMKIFDSGFNDRANISEGYEGYVAILKGMGVVQGDELGNFNPSNEISRADFSILLYKLLNK